MHTMHLAFEPSIQAATPAREQYRGMNTFQLHDWMEEQQEQAEIRHLRASIRTNGRVGMMELY